MNKDSNAASDTGSGDDLRAEWGIFIPSLLIILLISLPAVLFPKACEEFLTAIY